MKLYTGTQSQLDFCEQQAPGYTEIIMPALLRMEGDIYIWDVEHKAAKKAKAHRLKPRGLGDAVESTINAVTLGQGKRIAQGIAKAVGAKDCGCARRREKLNKLVPFG